MNVFQKTAVLVLRLLATWFIVDGLLGLALIAWQQFQRSSTAGATETDRLQASILWVAAGVILALISNPLGWLIGRDPDAR